MQIANFKSLINLSLAPNSERKSLWPRQAQSTPLDVLRRPNTSSASSSRKAAAAAKIADLKMRLEAMLKFAGIGKGNPAAAIGLAKELAAAIRAYGGAGGGAGGVDVPVPQLNMSSTSAEADAASSTTAVDSGSAAKMDAAASASTATTSANAKAGEGGGANHDAKAGMDSASAGLARTGAVKLGADKGLSAGDSQFLADAKSLMQQIKMLIRLETKKAEDEKKAQAAINQMEQAMSDAPAAIAQDNQIAESATPSVSSEYNASGAAVDAAPETAAISVSA